MRFSSPNLPWPWPDDRDGPLPVVAGKCPFKIETVSQVSKLGGLLGILQRALVLGYFDLNGKGLVIEDDD